MILFEKQESRVPSDPRDRIYSDINRDYMLEAISTVVDGDSLVQKVLIVLGTPYRSRKWRPLFGCKVKSRLFEPFDAITADWISSDLISALEDPNNGLTEDIQDIIVNVVPGADQSYHCSVSWYEPKLGRNNSTNFKLLTQR